MEERELEREGERENERDVKGERQEEGGRTMMQESMNSFRRS